MVILLGSVICHQLLHYPAKEQRRLRPHQIWSVRRIHCGGVASGGGVHPIRHNSSNTILVRFLIIILSLQQLPVHLLLLPLFIPPSSSSSSSSDLSSTKMTVIRTMSQPYLPFVRAHICISQPPRGRRTTLRMVSFIRQDTLQQPPPSPTLLSSSFLVASKNTYFNYHPPQPRRYRSSSSSSKKGSNDSNNGSSSSNNNPAASWRNQIHVSTDAPSTRTTSLAMTDTMTTTTPVSCTTTATTTMAAPENRKLQFADTPLGKNGLHLLDGLDHYTVYSTDDGHPLSVYGIQSQPHFVVPATTTTKTNSMGTETKKRKPILLLHGRTWSSVPVYHLLGGPFNQLSTTNHTHESRSLMEALIQQGLQPYCMDFRGFGGTHPDSTNCVEPYQCVQDAETVLQWIIQRHELTNEEAPALLGWSQGALVAQLVAQRNHHPKALLSKVILYGSIYDPLVRYPREPLYVTNPTPNQTTIIHNHLDAAIEDFTVEGTIPPEPARLFAEAALLSDPIKVVWKNLYQFNNCDPARVHVPCLVIAGDQDPYAPLHVQQELFCNLARASDRTWSILSGSDHACHLLDGRFRLINTVTSFVMNGKRSEQRF
jgi:pimeloyl-ACP methyl ester carboxylesterase